MGVIESDLRRTREQLPPPEVKANFSEDAVPSQPGDSHTDHRAGAKRKIEVNTAISYRRLQIFWHVCRRYGDYLKLLLKKRRAEVAKSSPRNNVSFPASRISRNSTLKASAQVRRRFRRLEMSRANIEMQVKLALKIFRLSSIKQLASITSASWTQYTTQTLLMVLQLCHPSTLIATTNTLQSEVFRRIFVYTTLAWSRMEHKWLSMKEPMQETGTPVLDSSVQIELSKLSTARSRW